jgi:hypothetical protein
MAHDFDYHRNRLPKCPHCGKDFDVWAGDNPQSLNCDDGGFTNFECNACGHEFVTVTFIDYKFSTAVSDEAAEDEEWGPLGGRYSPPPPL